MLCSLVFFSRAGQNATVVLRQVLSKAITTRTPSCAIVDSQLRANINTTSDTTSADRYPARDTTNVKSDSASQNRATPRSSADDVTAAYTLLQPPSAQWSVSSGAKEKKVGRTSAKTPCAVSSRDWSVNNIGFNDIKSETRARIEKENHDGYERAAFASRDADKSYLAEATHFRFRYPHTLGRIEALSKVRSDRVCAHRDRIHAGEHRKGH